MSLIFTLSSATTIAYAMPAPVPATQTDKQKAAAAKAKEAEKKKKEQEKAKAQKAKEQEKAKAAKAKEQEKAKAAKAKEIEKTKAAKEKEKAAKEKEKEKAAKEKEKAAEARAKEAEKREEAKAQKEEEAKAKEEKAIRDYEKYQESLANPKTEVVSYFNLGIRAGYSAMMDKIQPNADGSLWGAGTLNQKNALQQLKGGGGAGLDLTYNLEYGHFLFVTGLDFRFLNSTSNYGFQASRMDQTYGATYTYMFDNLRETRNMLGIGVPVMFGAQFSRYYFLLGAKVHYALPMGYSQKGKYDITVSDPALLEPYGMGIHEINGNTNQAIKFAIPEVSLAAEVGIDLDEWLQAQPDPKKKTNKIKPGQRLPFGREHIHYRVGLFAEYGVLNTNATPVANPVEFSPTEVEVQNTNTMLAMNGDTKLNNLFVGAKFTIQFEVPGKKARPVPPPPAYAIYSVVDERTNEPLQVAFVETRGTESGKIAMRSKQIGPKGFRQRHALGSFTAEASAEGYKTATQVFQIEQVGSTQYVTIALRPCPIFRVRVTNKETGMVVPANVQIIPAGATEPAYTLATDSVTGSARKQLEEGPQYKLHIAQMGYDTLDVDIAYIGDSMNVTLSPIKKGEKFVVKNLFFATNKTRILARSEEALNDLYMYLARNPQVRIKIVGHTDSVGKDEANQKLSDGRANEVMKDLIERGIAADRLEAEGRGETQPIDTNDTDEGRQNNRRVEIEIL
ncbi:MAG: OmpA family protein [Paludibacteraceae bacterium]|nr:OmpA family protein [Paludibacteraceae bacterium]